MEKVKRQCDINKEIYNTKYQKKKYNEDEEYRERKKAQKRLLYRKKKERLYIEKHGNLDGFVHKEYKKNVTK